MTATNDPANPAPTSPNEPLEASARCGKPSSGCGRRQSSEPGGCPAAALTQQVNEEWSFAQTLRHLVFITDAWASRTVLDEEMPYHPLGLPQSWYPPADAAALGIDLTARPGYAVRVRLTKDGYVPKSAGAYDRPHPVEEFVRK